MRISVDYNKTALEAHVDAGLAADALSSLQNYGFYFASSLARHMGFFGSEDRQALHTSSIYSILGRPPLRQKLRECESIWISAIGLHLGRSYPDTESYVGYQSEQAKAQSERPLAPLDPESDQVIQWEIRDFPAKATQTLPTTVHLEPEANLSRNGQSGVWFYIYDGVGHDYRHN
jgi:hypothetical protein